MEYKGLPIYIVDFNDDSVFNNVAIVDFPAIEENFIRLSQQMDLKFSINEEKRVISGPALVPDFPIYREVNGKKFYIKFTEETIKKYAIKFFKDGRENEGNLQHMWGVNGITFFESYLLNRERGIAPKEFETLPDGTWMLTAKVENDRVWELIKDGTLRGFSVDIQSTLTEEKDTLSSIKDLLDYINNK